MIRLGLNVPNFGPETDPAALLGWANFADRNGFSTLMVSDHVVPTEGVAAVYPAPFYDPFVLLAWLAGQTTAVRLGTSVLVVPYRHPLLTARMSAVMHALSGGRFVLGVGVGWARTEFDALGLELVARGRTTDAYLEVITNSWVHEPLLGDVATVPVRIGGPVPIWVGGASMAAIRRAARFGEVWHPINPEFGWLRGIGIPALHAAAAQESKAVPQLVPRIKARLLTESAAAGRPLGLGTPDQIADDVAALAGLGAVEVILDPNPDSPRPRDFCEEQRLLLDVKKAYEHLDAAR